ncbi:hypothetical protein C8T65DRAFT_757763 [Cerioporus squamosus]|nr:hypothetical protein C8T65DRAFT_757763 [Cerioporus squamosus]
MFQHLVNDNLREVFESPSEAFSLEVCTHFRCPPEGLDRRSCPQSVVLNLKDGLLGKYPGTAKADAWHRAAAIVNKDSHDMVEGWITEIDALPTFAGLFAAALTAFNVESYKLLLPSKEDPTPAILVQISAQLGSLSVGSSFINSTQPPYNLLGAPEEPFRPSLHAVLLNSLWFISLVLSLATGTIGILVKQWLREFLFGLSGESLAMARRRQYRLNSLTYWRVAFIVSALPVLLHLAFVLFLAGLLVFLHSIDLAVMGIVAVPVAALLVLMCGTAIIPSVFSDCCLYSPQAHAIFSLREQGKRLLVGFCSVILGAVSEIVQSAAQRTHSFGYGLQGALLRLTGAVRRASTWTRSFYPSIWKHGELRFVDSVEATSHLDIDMFATAYTASSDIQLFDSAEAYLISTSEDERELAAFALRAFDTTTQHWGDRWPQDVLHRYYQLVNCVIQTSLATSFNPYEWERRGWDMEDLFPARLLRTLSNDAQVSSRLRADLDAGVGDLPDPSSYRLVLASMDQKEPQVVRGFLRSLAFLSMHPRTPDPLGVWHDLVWGVGHLGDALDWQAYTTVAAAAGNRFVRVFQEMVTSDHTGGRGPGTRISPRMARDLTSTIDALRLYLLCLARPALEASPPLQDVPTIKLYATAALSMFRRTVLTTSLWITLCKVQSPGMLRPYAELVNAVAQLAESLHGASLVTASLVDDLERALQEIRVEHGTAIEAVRYTYIIASCRQVLKRLRARLEGRAGTAPPNGFAGTCPRWLVSVTADVLLDFLPPTPA